MRNDSNKTGNCKHDYILIYTGSFLSNKKEVIEFFLRITSELDTYKKATSHFIEVLQL